MRSALIVDDNYYNRDLAALALRHVGYEITEAENGSRALSILADKTFDLLILDLSMPDLNGSSVLQQVRSQSIHNEMVVIVMTANPHMSTDEVEAAANYVMYKPIDITEFARFVQRVDKAKEIKAAKAQESKASNSQ